MGNKQQFSLRAHFSEDLAKVLLGVCIQPGERLVEQTHVRLLGVGTRKKRPLLLPAAQRIDLAAREGSEVRYSQRFVHDVAILFFKLPPSAQIGEPAHRNHAAHGDRKIPVNETALREVGNAPRAAWLVAVQLNCSRLQGDEPRNRFQ